MQDRGLIVSDEFLTRANELKDNIRRKIEEISKTKTPQVDGKGKKIINQKDGRDYIIVAYMETELDRLFPGWSWRRAGGLTIFGTDWIMADGELEIIDENLVGLGVIPPIRRYWGGDAVRVQFKQGSQHIQTNIIDFGDNVQQAISGAFKRSVNRLTHIGDDIYGKRMDYNGMGSYEDVLASTGSATAFTELIEKQYKLKWGEVFTILKISSLTEITDFAEALETIKKAKGY